MSHKVGDFQEDNFEQKLLGLKDTQDSIQSLSAWCLKYQQQHKKVVGCWLHVLKKVKVEQRVTLFYLANDVIQYSKRKNFPFVESWATALQKATPLVRDDKVKHKILRLFKIWGERAVYDDAFLSDLCGLLTAHTKKNSTNTADLIQEFQPTLLFSKIRKCKLLEEDTDLKLKLAKECSIPVSDLDALQVAVKDRRNGDDLMQDIDEGIVKLEAYTKALELEIKERIEVINVLEVSEQFYETQRGEAKVVCNAYRNFGSRIKSLKRKLEELVPTLPSPVPSPDIDAPSPSSGSDLEMPEDNAKPVRYDSEKSFIGTDFVTAMNAAEKQNQYARNLQQHGYDPQFEIASMHYNMQESQASYEDFLHTEQMDPPTAGYYKNNSQTEMESPSSPAEKQLIVDPYAYRPEGNPIEVINSGLNDVHDFRDGGTGSFLQNLMSNPPPVPTQSKIPGLESPTDNAREVFSFIESKVKSEVTATPLSWDEKPLTKYQSWPSPDISWNHTQETPVSPPAFEQESYVHPPVEYIDTSLVDGTPRFQQQQQQQQQPLLLLPPPPLSFNNSRRSADVDHRMLNAKPNDVRIGREFGPVATIPLPKHDIDDRLGLPVHASIANCNLIPLTDSPSVNDSWKATDSDYRAIPMPPIPPISLDTIDGGSGAVGSGRPFKPALDNIESVDMEMSDDEEDKGSRHRKPSFKDEDAGGSNYHQKMMTDRQSQLMPPPNPWDMVSLSRIDNEDDGGGGGGRNRMNFDKMIPPNFTTNARPGMEQPPPPNLATLPDFTRFSMPPPGTPPRGTSRPLGPMRFARPPIMRMPPRDPSLYHPRMDFVRPSANLPNHMPTSNFGQPFNNFMSPFAESNSNRPPAFPNAAAAAAADAGPNNMNRMTPRESSFVGSYTDRIGSGAGSRPPYQRLHAAASCYQSTAGGGVSSFPPSDNGASAQDRFHQRQNNSINTIEPIIKNRQFDKRVPDSGVPFEAFESSSCGGAVGASGPTIKPSRSNLKEISLSDVLEKSMLAASCRNTANTAADLDDVSEQDDKADLSAIDSDDLFGEETYNRENSADDGDDLYNDIEETAPTERGGDETTPARTKLNNHEELVTRPPPSSDLAVERSAHFRVLDDETEEARRNDGDGVPGGGGGGGGDSSEGGGVGGNDDSVSVSTPSETNRQQQRTPFQATVPKMLRPSMAPPCFIEDEERSPWPLMPVIDLSDENITGSPDANHAYGGADQSDGNVEDGGATGPPFCGRNCSPSDVRPRFNHRGGFNHRFSSPGCGGERFCSPGGDRRFANSMQTPSPLRMRGDMSNRRGTRFSSSGGGSDFRLRTPNFSSPNQEMSRMLRPPFSRAPSVANQRGSAFQNAPRLFKGRPPQRLPFRRGW